MSDVLSEYLAIYSNYPTDAFLSKAQRKSRHSALMKWAKHNYQAMPGIDEIRSFMRENNTLNYE